MLPAPSSEYVGVPIFHRRDHPEVVQLIFIVVHIVNRKVVLLSIIGTNTVKSSLASFLYLYMKKMLVPVSYIISILSAIRAALLILLSKALVS